MDRPSGLTGDVFTTGGRRLVLTARADPGIGWTHRDSIYEQSQVHF
jgi:hypothetical protein